MSSGEGHARTFTYQRIASIQNKTPSRRQQTFIPWRGVKWNLFMTSGLAAKSSRVFMVSETLPKVQLRLKEWVKPKAVRGWSSQLGTILRKNAPGERNSI